MIFAACATCSPARKKSRKRPPTCGRGDSACVSSKVTERPNAARASASTPRWRPNTVRRENSCRTSNTDWNRSKASRKRGMRNERNSVASGRLLVRGPNVMKGYLNPDANATFQALGGWYDTGDIAHVDAERFVTILGRLKRFAKVSGEM